MEKKELPIQRELRDLMNKYSHLLEMGISFARDKDLNHLLDLALSRARVTTNSHAGAIFLVETHHGTDGTKKIICFKIAQIDTKPDLSRNTAKFTLPFDMKSIAGYVAVTGKTLNIDDVYLIDKKPYKFDPSFDKKIGCRTRSLLAVPILSNTGEAIGVLELINRLDRRSIANLSQTREAGASPPAMPYSIHDVDMALGVAGLLGVALENIHMLSELKDQNIHLDQIVKKRTRELNNSLNELERKNRQVENDLNIAHNMQINIVPQKEKMEFLSLISLLGISSVFKPSNKLGGDFWDILELDQGKIGIIMVDFAGHGIAPSLNTFRIKEFIHSLAYDTQSPKMYMERMNENIFKNYNMHATCIFAIYNKHDKKLTYCRAGHPYGIYYKKTEDKLIEFNLKGMSLGFLPDQKYEEKEIILEAGDKLVFYTDGIIEAMNKNNEFFGVDRLKDVILKHKNNSNSEMSNAIMKYLTDFIGEVELDDDITLVVMEQKEHFQDCKILIPSKIELANRVTDRISLDARELGFSKKRLSELQLCLNEAFMNAIKNGNKFDINKKVRTEWEREDDGIRISIEDEGEGGNPDNISNPLDIENFDKENLRAIHLIIIQQFSKEVKFNSKGNRITFLMQKESPAVS